MIKCLCFQPSMYQSINSEIAKSEPTRCELCLSAQTYFLLLGGWGLLDGCAVWEFKKLVRWLNHKFENNLQPYIFIAELYATLSQ